MDDAPLLHAIRIIKANGATVEARHILRAASEDLLASGAETQLVGCSEFSLIADATSAEARMIDTLDVLVDAGRGLRRIQGLKPTNRRPFTSPLGNRRKRERR